MVRVVVLGGGLVVCSVWLILTMSFRRYAMLLVMMRILICVAADDDLCQFSYDDSVDAFYSLIP